MVHRWITLTCSSAGDEGSWSKLLLPELLPLFLNMLVMIPPPLLWNLRPAVQNQVTLGTFTQQLSNSSRAPSEYCSWVCPKTSNWMKWKSCYELWWWRHIKTSSSVWPQSERNSHHEEHKKTDWKYNEKTRIVAGKKKKVPYTQVYDFAYWSEYLSKGKKQTKRTRNIVYALPAPI